MKIYLALALTVCFVESAPVNLGTLEFDNLDTDLSALAYEVEEEDLDDISKLLDSADDSSKGNSNSASEESSGKGAKSNVKVSGSKKKNTENEGAKAKFSIADLKKFYKAIGAHDQGAYDDANVYALAEGLAGAAVGVDGKENRTYRKGTKTKGFHRVHHKDEYKKDQEFYEDDETKGTINKVGAKGLGIKVGAGAGFNKGRFHHDRQKGVFGKQGYADKGYFDKEFSGYSDSEGFDGSFSKES